MGLYLYKDTYMSNKFMYNNFCTIGFLQKLLCMEIFRQKFTRQNKEKYGIYKNKLY